MFGRPNTKHLKRAAQLGHDDRIKSDGARPEHEYRIAYVYLTTFDGVQRGWQGTPAGHEDFWLGVQANTANIWFQINLFRPSTAQAIVKAVSDAVDLSLRTAR